MVTCVCKWEKLKHEGIQGFSVRSSLLSVFSETRGPNELDFSGGSPQEKARSVYVILALLAVLQGTRVPVPGYFCLPCSQDRSLYWQKVQRRMRQNFLWEICHLSAADKSQVAEDAAGVALNDIKESLESLGGFGESLGSSIPSL